MFHVQHVPLLASGAVTDVPVVGAATDWRSVPEPVRLAVVAGLHDGLHASPPRDAYVDGPLVIALNYQRGREAGAFLCADRPAIASALRACIELQAGEVVFALAAAERGNAFA